MEAPARNRREGRIVKEAPKPDGALVPVELEEERSLAERAERSLIERLQRMEDAAAVFERRAQLLETCHQVAIRRTRPQDWVLFNDNEGIEVAMLTASGAQLVAEVYGIAISNVRPIDERTGLFAPKVIKYANGAFAFRGTCDAWSRVNGRSIENIEAARRSDEPFTGRTVDKAGKIVARGGDAALDADLRSSVFTLLQTKAVRILCGMTRVPIADLARAWEGTGKKVEQCRKGHGYGRAAERTAAAVADADVPAAAEAIWKEILALPEVAGDEMEAGVVLKELTANPDAKDSQGKPKPFAGVTSWKQITKGWQIARLREKLAARRRETGQEG